MMRPSTWSRGSTTGRSSDYRIDPENGNLPQRWMALPLLAADIKLPSFNRAADLNEWSLAQLFFYERGNDPDGSCWPGG